MGASKPCKRNLLCRRELNDWSKIFYYKKLQYKKKIGQFLFCHFILFALMNKTMDLMRIIQNTLCMLSF